MRYTITETIGEVSVMKDYEGTPEGISQLLNLMEVKESVNLFQGVEWSDIVAQGDNGPYEGGRLL